MMRKSIRDNSLSVVALLIAAMILLIAAAVLAQTSGAGRPSGKPKVVAGQLAETPQKPSFGWARTYDSGGFYAYSVAVGDVNGDGHPDLVVANWSQALNDSHGKVSVLLGNGYGTFRAPVSYPSGGYGNSSVAIGDVNGDGKLDLVVGNASGDVAVLLGNGDGTFQEPVSYNTAGIWVYSVSIGDVNGDGHADLVVTSACQDFPVCGSGEVNVLLGNGDGTFRPPLTYDTIGLNAYSAALVDVNSDGHLDLVVANECQSATSCSGAVSVLLGNADGTFQAPVNYSSGGYYAMSVAVEDVNGDGYPDVVVANLCASINPDGSCNSGSELSVLLGNGDGSFQSPVSYSSGGNGNLSVAIGDVNADGYPDLVVTMPQSGSDGSGAVAVLVGDGDGTFQPAVAFGSGGWNSWGATPAAVADVNGDGKPDVLVANECKTKACSTTGSVGVLLNEFAARATTKVTSSPSLSLINQVVTFTATITSNPPIPDGEVVTFSGASQIGTATTSNGVASLATSFSSAGKYTIKASYPGDLFHKASSGTVTQGVVNLYPSSARLTSSMNPSRVGQPVTFTATVTSTYGPIPDGELVTFHEGTTTLGSVALAGGTAVFTTSALSAKSHTIKATYAGDTTFEPSTGLVVQVVDTYPTTTTLGSIPNPSAYGQTVTFTSTITPTGPYPLTGNVWFKDGTIGIGSATLSGGVAILTKKWLAPGTHAITAQYLGDSANGKSTSALLNQVVQ